MFNLMFGEVEKEVVRAYMKSARKRVDGRAFDEISLCTQKVVCYLRFMGQACLLGADPSSFNSDAWKLQRRTVH